MNDFWGNADGDEKKAFSTGFQPLPDGTEAIAQLDKAEFDESGKFGPLYNLTWKIVDGEYTNRLVFQALGVFDQDEVRATRAKNLLMYLFKLFNVSVPARAPTTQDLSTMVGRLALIKVGVWVNKEGKAKNVINEIHTHGDAQLSAIESAFSRNPVNNTKPEDDIPF